MNATYPSVGVARRLLALRQQDWLALMLLGLHLALVFGIDTAVSQAFLLFHFGCFLLWQPVWRGEQKLYVGQALLVVAAAVLLVASESWWLLALWISVVFALIGGEVPAIKNLGQRLISLIAAVYLLGILLIWVVPHLFGPELSAGIFRSLILYGPVPLLALIFFVKSDRESAARGYALDLLYSLLLFLMVVVLVLGAFVIRQLSHGNYPLALAQALLATAAILIALSWLWDPRAGFAGIGHLLTRYLLSVGMPFERWMQSLANLADQERDPEQFLILAAQNMSALPWVSGVEWRTGRDQGLEGYASRHATPYVLGELTLTVYTEWSPGPALTIHIRLLARLLADYYEAKQREQQQRQNAYLHAIYETGSRLTHDIKNLLQSLNSLCSAVENSSEQDAVAVTRLTQRQLPQISQRLQQTLDKLERRTASNVEWTAVESWWQALQQRYSDDRISFETNVVPSGAQLPADLFDTAVDNFVSNALSKRPAQAGLQIRVCLRWLDAPCLEVCDNGEPVAEAIARKLFSAPVSSRQGFGVGLYQVARQAASIGYEVRLARNDTGAVCFSTRPAPREHGPVETRAASLQSPSG